jgi:hypothetical protein
MLNAGGGPLLRVQPMRSAQRQRLDCLHVNHSYPYLMFIISITIVYALYVC